MSLNPLDKPFPLKGFIVANGAIDYRFDPHVSALDMLFNFNIIPLSLYREYQANNCSQQVQWIWFYIEGQKPEPPKLCLDMFIKALSQVEFNVYDLLNLPLREIPPPKKFGIAKVNGTEREY